MPCICAPAREAENQGRGMDHLTLWCGTCSAEDHRDTRFYEPPHQVGYGGPVSGWMTQPDALARRRQRPGATAAGRSAARTVTMLMIWLAVCALTMLTALADAACPAATANSAGFGELPPSLSTVMVTSYRRGSSVMPGTVSPVSDIFVRTMPLTIKRQRHAEKCSSKAQQPHRTATTKYDRQRPLSCVNDPYRPLCP